MTNCPTDSRFKFYILYIIITYIPVRSLAVGTTECLFIYYFSTERIISYGNEKICNSAPFSAHLCIVIAVTRVSMSYRNTANKL